MSNTGTIVKEGKNGKTAKPVRLPRDRHLAAFISTECRWRPLFLPFLLSVVAVPAVLFVDFPLARWCVEGHCPELLAQFLDRMEPFGCPEGVVAIAMAIYLLDPSRRGALLGVLVMSLGSGLAADVVKLLVVRTRPRNFAFEGAVWDTFGQWLPLTSAGSSGQSFPSAHTATAVGLAAALIWLYPRGRWLFVALAALVACQRIACGAHYLSDTLCGTVVACLVAAICLRSPLAAKFDRPDRR